MKARIRIVALCATLFSVCLTGAFAGSGEIQGAAGANFGFATAGTPDISGDGQGDILVGAPAESGGLSPQNAGRAYLFDGGTHNLIYTLQSPNETSFGAFGTAVAGIADISGGGKPDIIVGAQLDDPNGTVRGQGGVYIFRGEDGKLLRKLQSPSPLPNGRFGYSVAAVPDTNVDGIPDIIVGAPTEGGGRAFLFSGLTGALLFSFASDTPIGTGRYGWAVGGVTDLDNMGFGDIIITDPAYGLNQNIGIVYIYSGETGVELHRYTTATHVRLGYSLATLGDVTGDGYPDILVGAQDTGPRFTGAAYLISGDTGAVVRTHSGTQGSYFGIAAARVPDLTSDGVDDYAIASLVGDVKVYNGSTGSEVLAYPVQYNGLNASESARISLAGVSGDTSGDVLHGLAGLNLVTVIDGDDPFTPVPTPTDSPSPSPSPTLSPTPSPSPSPTPVAPPINDDCPEAIEVCPGAWQGTSLYASQDGAASCDTGDSPDVWYVYTAGDDGTLSISLCLASYDTLVSVHSGCPGTTGNELACNDDSTGPECADTQKSEVSLSVTTGLTYWIRVSGFNGSQGNFMLEFEGPECGEPAPPIGGLESADFDFSGCTSIPDFLFLLDHWQLPFNGSPMGVTHFLRLLDDWNTGPDC